MDLEGIMLSEISQTKTNTEWSHLYVKSTKAELREKRRVAWCLPGAGFLKSWPAGSAFLHTSHPPLFLPQSLPSLLSLQRFQIVQVARSNPSFLLVSREERPSLVLSRNCFFLLWSAPVIISMSLSPWFLSPKSPPGVQLALRTKAAATEGPWLFQLSSGGCAVSPSFCSEWRLADHGSCHPAIGRSHHLPFKHAKILQIPYVLDGPRGHHAKWNKSDKDKYWMISLICEIHKSWTQRKAQSSLMFTRGRGGVPGRCWSSGTDF